MSQIKLINENLKKHSKIPDNIIKIITLINQTLFKYIKDNLNDKNYIEKKLLDIYNKIKEICLNKQEYRKILKSEKVLLKSYNKPNLFIQEKSNNSKSHKNLKDSNNKNITNPNIISQMDSNQYLTLKLKRKLKLEHDKNKIKELEYLERIAILQFKLNLYEKNLEKLILENKTARNVLPRDNSLKSETKRILNGKYYLKIKNLNNKEKEKDIKLFRPLSNTIDSKISNLKQYFKDFSEKQNSKKKNYAVETYINANTNSLDSYLNRNRNLKRNGYNGINDLHYKYQIGNNFIRNDFRQLKKTIHKNNTKIDKLINNCE